MFKEVLPKDKFVPVMDRKIDESKAPALKEMPEGAYNFHDLLVRGTEKLHQADPARLRILQLQADFKYKNSQKRLLQFSFSAPIELFNGKESSSRLNTKYPDYLEMTKLYLREEHEKATANVIKALRDSKFDCEYEVNQIMLQESREVDRRNEERRQEMTHSHHQYVEIPISDKFIESMKSFQRVLQISFESTMRDIYTQTVDEFKAQLRFAIEKIEQSTGKSMIPTSIHASDG